MSRRSSAGDLVPRDISEILAREGKAQRGQRKAGASLGQAFSWLKGNSKKKNSLSNGHGGRSGGGGTGLIAEGGGAKPGHQNHDSAKAGPKGQEEKRLAVLYTASQHQQENVFLEASRPQYLEDLHSEAQEGLKIQQQEEHQQGVEFQHDQGTASLATVRAEEQKGRGSGSQERDASQESGRTAGNSDNITTSAATTVSTTRPVLTRQGSTFKPLNPVKRPDRGKKRSRRTTIMGIPQQVQRELALHRGMMYQQSGSSQIPNGQVGEGLSEAVVIPTIDGEMTVANQEGARVHLQDLEASREEKLLQRHLQAVYKDEQAFSLHRLGSRLSPGSTKRPKSLAVPGVTSSYSPSAFLFLQEPQGPVMCISPQATYLSKIIPNAVLPASVDVIQIDRGNGRNRGNSLSHGGNGRTASKSSLASGGSSASPASSRRSGGSGSHSDSAPDDAGPPPVTPSGWSQSQSSDTVMSNSSTISYKGRPGVAKPPVASQAQQGGPPQRPIRDQDAASLRSLESRVSGASSPGAAQASEYGTSEMASGGGETGVAGGRDSRLFTRSLSVMKNKLPPTPPRRTNSLHHDGATAMQRERPDAKGLGGPAPREGKDGEASSLTREDTRVISTDTNSTSNPAESGPLNNPGSSSASGSPTTGGARRAPDPQPVSSSSSPQKAPSEGVKFERTLSPSSGYSSQSGTPTLSPKGMPPISPSPSGKQKKKPVKPERTGSRVSSSPASVSSSLTSLSSSASEPVNHEARVNSPSPPQRGSPPTVAVKTQRASPVASLPANLDIRELLNIPPPPKVKAPSPPPPETWFHNRHTFELLCGSSLNVNLRQPKATNQAQKTESQAKVIDKPQGSAEKEPAETKAVLSLSENASPDKTEPLLENVPERLSQENESVESPKEGESVSGLENGDAPVDNRSLPVKEEGGQERVAKKEPPPVMRKSSSTYRGKGPEKFAENHQQAQASGVATEVNVQSASGNDESALPEVDVAVDEERVDGKVTTENAEKDQATPQPVAMQTQSVDPPEAKKISPPPSPPPTHHPPPPPSKSTPPSSVSEEDEGAPASDTCWPPPPPPLEGAADSVFDGPDEMDFPPPPPPFVTEGLLPDVVESCSPSTDASDVVTALALEETGASPSGEESADVSETEVAGDPVAAAPIAINPVISELPEPQEASHVSVSTSQSQEVPPLPEGVPPPPQMAPPPPPVTSAEDADSSPTIPAMPSLVAPLPPAPPGEDRAPPSPPPVSAPGPPPTNAPPPPLAENQSSTLGVTFRRLPSLAGRESRGKELLSRHKSAPVPKEDANIPLVTPSLLQMVRLRSVTVGDAEQQVMTPPEDSASGGGGGSGKNQGPTSAPEAHSVPQKPVRKSLSIKLPSSSTRATPVMAGTPSVRLQEAIRLKTAAMSARDGLPGRLSLRHAASSANGEFGPLSLRLPDGGEPHRSPASTASFIFSRSTKKVVIETPISSSPEAQASLKQNLAAELMQVSDQSQANTVVPNGIENQASVIRRPSKVPPPVAKKPACGTSVPLEKPLCSGGGAEKTGAVAEMNGGTETEQPPGQQGAAPDQQIGTTETTDVFDTPL